MTFDSLSNPIINFEGAVAFGGSVVAAGGSETGVWQGYYSSGRLNLTAKENSTYRRSPGLLFGSENGERSFGPPMLSRGANLRFRGRLKGASVTDETDSAMFLGGFIAAGVSIDFREGDRIGFPTVGLEVGDLFAVSESVQETSLARIPVRGGSASADTAFNHGGQAFTFEGERFPGTSATLGDLADTRPIRAMNGSVLFRARTSPSGRTEIALTPDNPISLAEEGQVLENALDLHLGEMNHPGVTYAGNISDSDPSAVFGARITGASVGPTNDSAIVRTRIDSSRPFLSVREGSQVPGAQPGVLFGDLATDNIVGGGNRGYLFSAQLRGPTIDGSNDCALFAATPGATFDGRIFAQEGQHVDGLPVGSVLSGLDAPHFQFNLMGEAIFNAEFVGPNGNGVGLFYNDMNQPGPSLIARTGQSFDIGGGVLKTISEIGLLEMSNPWEGRAAQINDRRQIVFDLTFSDGTQGIFGMTVPEPGTIVLASAAGIVMAAIGLRRRRRRAA